MAKKKNTTSIRINERFEIRSDPYCWVLVEHIPVDQSHHKSRGKNKTKEEHTYHSTISDCCRFMLREAGKDDCSTLGKVLDEQRSLITAINSKLELNIQGDT